MSPEFRYPYPPPEVVAIQRERTSRVEAPAEVLAADYKSRPGMNACYAWDMFVIERGLRPEMDARHFYALYDRVAPCPLAETVILPFQPTHWDTVLGCYVSFSEVDDPLFGRWIEGIWDFGMIGHSSLAHSPLPPRYLIYRPHLLP